MKKKVTPPRLARLLLGIFLNPGEQDTILGDLDEYFFEEVNWNSAGILSRAGAKVALASGANLPTSGLLGAAMFAARHGMSRDEALKAVTLSAAQILGVAERVGSLEEGKDADVLILSGDPLAATSRLERVILKGQTVHQNKP